MLVEFGLFLLNHLESRLVNDQVDASQVVTQKVTFFDLVFAVLLYRKLEVFLMIFPPFLNESGILFCRKEPGLVTRQPVGYTAFRVTGLC